MTWAGPRIVGYCPMGCGGTLYRDAAGRVMCDRSDCPWPTAATDILNDDEAEHLVTFDEDGFSIKHPLRERLADDIFTCDLHHHCATLAGPPHVGPGIHRARELDGGWLFQKLAQPPSPPEDGRAADPESAPADLIPAGDALGSAATVHASSTQAIT